MQIVTPRIYPRTWQSRPCLDDAYTIKYYSYIYIFQLLRMGGYKHLLYFLLLLFLFLFSLIILSAGFRFSFTSSYWRLLKNSENHKQKPSQLKWNNSFTGRLLERVKTMLDSLSNAKRRAKSVQAFMMMTLEAIEMTAIMHCWYGRMDCILICMCIYRLITVVLLPSSCTTTLYSVVWLLGCSLNPIRNDACSIVCWWNKIMQLINA